MSYSSYGIIALLVYAIINRSILFDHDSGKATPAQRSYRGLILAIMSYLVTDILWGVLDQMGLHTLLYADTVVYYIAMASSVLLWTRYVIAYLDERDAFERALHWVGRCFFASVLLVSLANLRWPILFWFDEQGAYHAAVLRYVFLIVQIVMFMLTAVYTLVVARQPKGHEVLRHRAIGMFGIAMSAMVVAQYLYPLLPLYSAGLLLGGCVLHSFVMADEREEYLSTLEAALKRERESKEQLEEAIRMANTDPLTGVKSKRAFVGAESSIDELITGKEPLEFAIAVFDLNDLKHINDTLGHEQGDVYIISACRIICDLYDHSPVFRTGGDEFAAILEGRDYASRKSLLAELNKRMEANQSKGGVVVAAGMATYDPMQDDSFRSVFIRADKRMYQRKHALKNMAGALRSS